MRERQIKRFEVGVTKAQPKRASTGQRSISIPIKKSNELLNQKVIDGLRRLEDQAEQINQLSAELERAMIELKTISTDVTRDLRAMQTTNKPFLAADICECTSSVSVVPYIRYKSSGSLLLTTRPVDLFKPEREAALVAKELRERTRRKRQKKLVGGNK